jgi:hypothetical protein
MNEKLPDMTTHRMSLDVHVLPKIKIKKDTTNI